MTAKLTLAEAVRNRYLAEKKFESIKTRPLRTKKLTDEESITRLIEYHQARAEHLRANKQLEEAFKAIVEGKND